MNPPAISMISNLTGSWLEPGQATGPDYWVEHACSTVRFDLGISTLLLNSYDVFLEIGAGANLCGFVSENSDYSADNHTIIPSLPTYMDRSKERFSILNSLKRLWIKKKYSIDDRIFTL